MFAIVVVLVSACSSSDADDAGPAESVGPTIVVESAWGAWFEDADVRGTFVLKEVGSEAVHVWNEARAGEPRLPASTFKILNSLIILETGTLSDVDEPVAWDGVVRDVDVWNQDHTLRSGIEVSAVWMYQALAREVGETAMQDWVDQAEYGNRDIGGGIDRFWLDGELRISPLEQIDFLERLVVGDLPFRPEVSEAVADILMREADADWTWSHKTGTALATDPVFGWLVGSTEHDGRRFVFAMNLDLEPISSVDTQLDPQVRQQLARRILEAAGALPPG
jgi:beta-lactamase class D